MSLRIDPDIERISRRLSKIDKELLDARGQQRAGLEVERAELLIEHGQVFVFEKRLRLAKRQIQRPASRATKARTPSPRNGEG